MNMNSKEFFKKELRCNYLLLDIKLPKRIRLIYKSFKLANNDQLRRDMN